MVQIPPLGGGDVAVQGGAVPKSQTTSVKNIGAAEAGCVLDTTVPGLVCSSHANR